MATGALGQGLPNFGEEFNKIRIRTIERLTEERRHSRRDLVVHPAVGHKVTKQERRMTYLKMATDPLFFQAKLDEQRDKWKLKPPVEPRNVLEFFAEEHKVFQKEQEA